MDSALLGYIRNHFISMPTDKKREFLSGKIARGVNINEIPEPQIIKYIKMAIEGCDNESIADLMMFEAQTTKIIKDKIGELLTAHCKKKFGEWLDTAKVKCGNSIGFPSSITLTKVSSGLSKGLYTEEGDMNDFEYRVINAIANLDNVLFWHRNASRGKGFCINGQIHHYPDFIVRLKSGYTIIIETKGDDRDNSDSRQKLELGQRWANKAGEMYRYFMVFDKIKLENAYTVVDLINILKNI